MARPAIRELPKSAGGLLSYFTRHKTAANLLLVLLLIAGLFSFPNMRSQFFPDVVVDNVRVSVTWEGAGAEDVDAGVVQVLEPALLAVEGIASTQSSSFEGRATITLEFEPGWDMSRAADDVETAGESVNNLPEDVDDPVVRRGAWRDRVTDIVITGPVDAQQLANFADELVIRLFNEGVTRTTIRGVATPRIIIDVPSVNLMARDISMAEVSAAIAAEVDANPAGDVDGANARVRTGSAKRTVADIDAIVVRTFDDGSVLTVGDLSTVYLEGVDAQRQYFVGENQAVSMRVDRSNAGDAIEVQRKVEDVAAEMQATLPQGVTVELIRTRAEAITGRLNILLDNGLAGLGLVVALLFLFLNARTAFWVAAGIPVAMFAAIAIMYLGGLTINMISLFGLIITLGIVVDDAIVVGEHADFRARNLGEPPVVAAENAARRMAMPVFAATVTTVIAFFGLTAVDGRFGDLIRDIPFTVIAVLAASLIECFLILPHHMSHALAAADKQRWYDWPSRTVNKGFEWVRDTLFRPLMSGVIRARYAVVAGVIVILASQVTLFLERDVQWRFFNAPERGSVTGNFAMVEAASREDSVAMMRGLQQTVEDLSQEYEERYGRNPVDYVIAEVGGNTGRGLSGVDTKDTSLLGSISVELIDADLRPYSSFAFLGDLQDRIVRHPLTEQVSFRGWRSGPGGDALDVQFYGADAETLKAAAEALKLGLQPFPEVSAVEDNIAYDKEELILELTPQGQALGFTIGELSRVLRNRLAGIEAATFPIGVRTGEVRVELPQDELTADFLERTQMRTPTGMYVPLADIVSVTNRTGFSTVKRENGIRLISVTGDISEDNPARATEIQQVLEQDLLPRIASDFQVEWQLSGLSEQEDRFLSDSTNGFILVLAGIYLALPWVFSSWTRPIVVMVIIPFGLVGTIYGHYAWDVPLSMFTVIGLIGMTGIIINDSIVLVTTIDQYRETRGLFASIIDGAADRLRPVLLTTLTTVLGLVPLLYEGSSQAQWLKPTVITLVYGLGFGMFLVLLVVPAVIAMQHDVGDLVRSMQKAARTRRATGLRALVIGLWVVVFGWGGATLGAFFVTGEIWSPIATLLPASPGEMTTLRALAVFVVGTGAMCFVGYSLGAIGFALRKRPKAQAA